MLGRVNDQSQRLTRDSEEMENLNRTLTGITKVYENAIEKVRANRLVLLTKLTSKLAKWHNK